MLFVFVFLGSFITALGIGYLGVFADQGIKVVAESKVGAKVGRWLFLLPLFDFVDHFISEIAPEIIRRIVSVIGLGLSLAAVVIATCAILAAIWFLGGILISMLVFIFAFLLRHLNWIIFGSVAILAVVQLAKRL